MFYPRPLRILDLCENDSTMSELRRSLLGAPGQESPLSLLKCFHVPLYTLLAGIVVRAADGDVPAKFHRDSRFRKTSHLQCVDS